MYEIKINKEKNRLYFILKDEMKDEDTRPFLEEFSRNVIKLREGFGIITDLSGLDAFERKAQDAIVPVMKIIKESDVGGVVRVVPKSSSGEAMVRLFEYKSKEVGYPSRVAHTMEEAEKMLDELESKK